MHDDVRLTAELLRKHDKPGPRYTSYPTAVEFNDSVGPDEYAARLARSDAQAGEPLSLYVHLPFCQERCTFCGCFVTITKRTERATDYLALVQREIDLVAQHLPHRRSVAQFHLGGGTPTYHTPEELLRLHQTIIDRFEILPGAEVAIEVDPRITTHAHVDALRSMGFNRLSMGVQDFTPEVQAIINRYQDLEQTRSLYEYCRAQGFGSINIDLIYGLPLQTPATFASSLDTVIAMRPDRIALYSFAFVPWKSGNQRTMTEDMMLPPEAKLELYMLGREKFTAAGYRVIGMDHFALPSDEMARAQDAHALHRNFMGYTVKPATDSIAFGVSGIGDLQGAYVQNLKDHDAYGAAVRAGKLPILRGVLLSPDDELRRHVILELMCNFHLDLRAVEQRFGIDFAIYFAAELARLRDDVANGFVVVTPDAIDVSPLGRVFIRNLCMVFDKYLRAGTDKPVFSRTI